MNLINTRGFCIKFLNNEEQIEQKLLNIRKNVAFEENCLSDGAWIDKETAETLIQVRKLQLGIEGTNGEFSGEMR